MQNNYVTLENRGLVTITGPDASVFLQNLVSNDIALLENQSILHACLLTPQGKFLHDFFISKTSTGYQLDCEGGERTTDLVKRLTLYKLRAQIDITARDDITIYVTDLNRVLSKPDGNEIPFDQWDQMRIAKAIPDGSRDAEIGVSTLAELNLDQTTVSYTKGCYIGQELVARMHNRNLGKKHLVAVRFKSPPPPFGTDMENIGQMRSSCGNLGLILINRDCETELRKAQNGDSEICLLGL